MDRERVSIKEIMNHKQENMTPKERANLPRDFVDYKPQLYRNLVVPSYVHGYSLAIEYMKKWFLSKFNKNYFKYVHINGKHVLDDWKHFNNYNIVREKPMLAIVPTVDFDNDREMRDAYLMDHTLLIKRSNFQQSFLKDYQTNTFLYLQMRELKMEFTFKVRVNSRSEQLDLFNKMELWFKIGATQSEYISADFHIPYDIMLNIASDNGFEIKNDKIVDIYKFLTYLNSHSDIPFIFKIRAINQKPEFFIRVKDLYTHISTIDKLQMDDGERQGKLDTNFHIEMRCTLRIPIPHFYAYFNQKPIAYTIGANEYNGGTIGIYTINSFEIMPENDRGWGQIAVVGYMTEKGEEFIDLSSILYNGGELGKVIEYTKNNGINPNLFLDIKVYRGDVPNKLIYTSMDYNNNYLYFEKPQDREEDVDIVIYGDREYMNNVLLTIDNFEDSRIKGTGM